MTTKLNKSFVVWLITAMLMGVAASAAAHKYFFAITDISYNNQAQRLEIIHQLTAHDVENAIARINDTHFNPEHPQYELFIQQYVTDHFNLSQENQQLPITWIGVENKLDKIYVYQEVSLNKFLIPLVVKNDLLVDTYPKQVNTVNFENNDFQVSLTFNKSQQVGTIDNNK
ncbi:DUF6702 family protein [Colwellia sp. MEBiC06753]